MSYYASILVCKNLQWVINFYLLIFRLKLIVIYFIEIDIFFFHIYLFFFFFVNQFLICFLANPVVSTISLIFLPDMGDCNVKRMKSVSLGIKRQISCLRCLIFFEMPFNSLWKTLCFQFKTLNLWKQTFLVRSYVSYTLSKISFALSLIYWCFLYVENTVSWKKYTAMKKLRNKYLQSNIGSINYRKLILAKYAKFSSSADSRK